MRIDHNEFIKDILVCLRSRPDYWIINSEIYLEIIAKNEIYSTYSNDKYVNKDLLAIYNYIFMNEFKIPEECKRNNECPETCEDENKNLLNDYLGFDANESDDSYMKSLMNDKEYCKFVNFIERDSHFEIDYATKTLFDSSIVPLIYKFLIKRYYNRISKIFSCSNYHEIPYTIQIKIQNFILFFSYFSYDNSIDNFWNNNIENPKTNLINRQYKKYKLRINKIDEDELEQLYIQSQINILNLHEKISNLKKIFKIEEFINFLKENKVKIYINYIFKMPGIIIRGENQNDKSEKFLNMIICAYTQLNNILEIFEEYLKMNENNSIQKIEESEFRLDVDKTNLYDKLINYNKTNSSDYLNLKNSVTSKQFENFRNLFRIFKELKTLPHTILSNKNESIQKTKDFAFFYCVTVEKIRNYEGCLMLLKEYKKLNEIINQRREKTITIDGHNKSQNKNNFEKCFGSKLIEDDLNEITREYIDDYYEKQETKSKRVYKIENAGVNWTQEDIEKFEEGMNKYGHLQLANIKIAKFMGSHIEPSHVKLFRGRISKEKRIKRKFEKIEKISEMKKKKNLKWKLYEGELDSLTKSQVI